MMHMNKMISKLTGVDSGADADPEISQHIGSNTLTRLFGIVVWYGNRPNLGIGGPVVDETCGPARLVRPFTVFHFTRLIALD